MTTNWLLLIVVGLVVYAFSRFPPLGEFRPFAAVLGGILIAVGLLFLVLGLLGIAVPR